MLKNIRLLEYQKIIITYSFFFLEISVFIVLKEKNPYKQSKLQVVLHVFYNSWNAFFA